MLDDRSIQELLQLTRRANEMTRSRLQEDMADAENPSDPESSSHFQLSRNGGWQFGNSQADSENQVRAQQPHAQSQQHSQSQPPQSQPLQAWHSQAQQAQRCGRPNLAFRSAHSAMVTDGSCDAAVSTAFYKPTTPQHPRPTKMRKLEHDYSIEQPEWAQTGLANPSDEPEEPRPVAGERDDKKASRRPWQFSKGLW